MIRPLALAALLALALPAAADAARKPTGDERKAILAAVDNGYEDVVQPDATSLTNRGRGWRVYGVGAARAGCDVPPPVFWDLKLNCY